MRAELYMLVDQPTEETVARHNGVFLFGFQWTRKDQDVWEKVVKWWGAGVIGKFMWAKVVGNGPQPTHFAIRFDCRDQFQGNPATIREGLVTQKKNMAQAERKKKAAEKRKARTGSAGAGTAGA